jgi:putative ABC transport system permease protein
MYALRRLRASPVFTIAATCTIAIAIGATASVFGLVDGVLLKSFPYREPDRALRIAESNPSRQQPRAGVSTAAFLAFQAQNHSFSGLAAACCGDLLKFQVTHAQDAEQLLGLAVTADYFRVMGITPILGRPLSADTTSSEVVLSYGYWLRRFGGSRAVIGQTLVIDNANDARPSPRHRYTVVGVMPPGMPGPLDLWTQIFFEPGEENDYGDRYLDLYGRLSPGVTAAAGEQDLRSIAARLAVAYPKTNDSWSVVTVPLIDHLLGPIRPALIVLLAAAGCVLLIGTANLANLFLVRCLAREREVTLRIALGATRGRIVRGLVLEALAVGVAGCALGLLLAVGGARALRTLAPASLPRLSQVGVDWRVIAFCAAALIVTVLFFGVLPAWQATEQRSLATGARQQRRFQDGLVVLQVAIAVVLLTGAGLFVASFEHFRRIDPGYRADGVLTAQFALSQGRYSTADRVAAFLSSTEERLRAQPGVEAVGIAGILPAGELFNSRPFSIIGDPAADPSHMPSAVGNTVTPGYLPTMGIVLRRGRGFEPTDDGRALKVALIDELFARRFFGTRDPIGRQLSFVTTGYAVDTVTIVGVVGTVRQFGLAHENTPEVYFALAQGLTPRMVNAGVSAYVVLRTTGDPGAQARALERTIGTVDPFVPVYHVQTMTERTIQSVGTTRFASFLASLFAIVAFVLGVVGIYSLLSYVVAQRHREIAIRIAIGASPADVIGDVLRRAGVMTGIGVAIGLLSAWLLTRALAGLFLGVNPHDPAIFAGATAIFAVVALAAASVPAMRTARVDPKVALTAGG